MHVSMDEYDEINLEGVEGEGLMDRFLPDKPFCH